MKSYLPTRWSNRPFSSPHNNDQYLRKTWTDTWNQQRVSIFHRTNIYHHKMAIIFWSGRCWRVHRTNFKQHLCAKIDKTSKRFVNIIFLGDTKRWNLPKKNPTKQSNPNRSYCKDSNWSLFHQWAITQIILDCTWEREALTDVHTLRKVSGVAHANRKFWDLACAKLSTLKFVTVHSPLPSTIFYMQLIQPPTQ